MVSVRHTLTKMRWHQPPSTIQCDNSTSVRVKNSTLVPRKSKSWDLRLNWLRCRESQKQFRYDWDKFSKKWGDYITKRHPIIYHNTKRSLGFAGCVYYPYISEIICRKIHKREAKCRVRLARMWLLDNCWLPGDTPSTKMIAVTSRVQILVVTKSISTFSTISLFVLGSTQILHP